MFTRKPRATTDPCSDGNARADGYAYADAYPDSDGQAHGYIHTQADSHGYPAAANAYGHPAADGDSNGYPVPDRHAAADRHPTAHQTCD